MPLSDRVTGLVLVGDDDPVTRRIVSHRLNRSGYTIREAADGAEVVELARTEKPVAIILDLMMPVSDGFTTLKKLKNEPETKEIPIIILSGKDNDDDVVRCLDAGASDYLPKPFSPDELVARLRRCLPAR